MDRSQALIPLPYAAGALPQEAVGLPAKGHAGRRVRNLAAKSGHGLVILFVDGCRAEGLLHIWPHSLEKIFSTKTYAPQRETLLPNLVQSYRSSVI